MRVKTFTADDMQHAMQLVRETLGEDAVIISTKRKGKTGTVQITAAFDDMSQDNQDDEQNISWFAELNNIAPSGSVIPPQDNRPAPEETYTIPKNILEEVTSLMDFHGVNDTVAEQIAITLKNLNERDVMPFINRKPVLAWLSALMKHYAACQPLFPKDQALRHILIGTSGAGKTLTTAKIAAHCVQNSEKVHVISTDNKRAGGVEQLEAITDILGIQLHVAHDRDGLKALLATMPEHEHVIVDSAGANPYDFHELKALAEFASLIELTPVLVYPAGCDPYEASEVARAFSFMGVRQMIVTRTDTAKRFGSILNAAQAAGLCFANLTGSEQIVGSFNQANPQILGELFAASSSTLR